MRQFSKEEELDIINLYQNNKSQQFIYKKYRTDQYTIKYVLSKYKIPLKDREEIKLFSKIEKLEKLKGLKFGDLFIKSFDKIENHITYMNCICKCGTHCSLRLTSLKSGHTTSCGCNKSPYIEGIREKTKFGKLTIIEKLGLDKNSQTLLQCLCDCGKELQVTWQRLHSEPTISCGCGFKCFDSFDHYSLDILNNKTEYILGLMLSDGCITKNDDFRIYLKDYDLIEKLHLFFKSKLPIKTRKDVIQYGLTFRSKQLCNILRNYGIVEKKSKIAKVHEDLQNSIDFWRGMIDGDGSISFNLKKKSFRITLCGTIEVCQSFVDFVKRNGVDTKHKPSIRKDIENFAEVKFGNKMAYQICKLLYGNLQPDDLVLDRKLILANKIINHYKDKYGTLNNK